MNIQNIFPVSVGYLNNIKFTNKVLPIANSILDKTGIGAWNYTNTYNDFKTYSYLKSFNWIEDYIKQICREYINVMGLEINREININSLFVSRIDNTHSHDKHIHPTSTLSGVMYLDTIGSYAPLEFNDPSEIRNFHSLITKSNSLDKLKVPFLPSKGDIVIFESWVPHTVPKVKGKGNRTTLVFNTIIL